MTERGSEQGSERGRPPSRRLKGAGAAVVLVIIALIAVIFVGENMAQMKDKAHEQQVPQPQGGVQQTRPPKG